MKWDLRNRAIFCVVVLFLTVAISERATAEEMSWQFIENENLKHIHYIQSSRVPEEQIDAFATNIGETVSFQWNVHLPENFAEIQTNQQGNRTFFYQALELKLKNESALELISINKIEIVKENQMLFEESVANFSMLSSVKTLSNVPIKIKGTKEGLSLSILSKSFSSQTEAGLKELEGSFLCLTGEVKLTQKAQSDIAYSGELNYVQQTFNGVEQVLSMDTEALTTFGRKFVTVDGSTNKIINEKQSTFVVKNMNINSKNFEKYLFYDEKAQQMRWLEDIHDEQITLFSPDNKMQQGKFEITGLSGNYELVELSSPHEYLLMETGIPFEANQGTYEQSAGSTDYEEINGKKASEARQILVSFHTSSFPLMDGSTLEFSTIILIGLCFILLICRCMISFRERKVN
ncbi:MAG: hypothetical protein LBM95_05395 [Lactobacillales bacterium]|jgi:hypothetical protein|nr:hypothetical protein [Lactobacillales bacterium]